jgi:alpha-1,2-mannosyltransferase
MAGNGAMPSTPQGWASAVLFTVIAFLPFLAVFVAPKAATAVGRFLGWLLLKKTEGRRAQLVALMTEDDEKFQKAKTRSGTSKGSSADENDTGLVTDVGTVNDAGKAKQDWDGIVGFFHPFW